MSERFEKEIVTWYEESRITDLDYLHLEVPKPVHKLTLDNINFYCFHKSQVKHIGFSENKQLNFISDTILSLSSNLEFIYDRLGLSIRYNIKKFSSLEAIFQSLESRVSKIEKDLTSTKNRVSKLAVDILEQKPITKNPVQGIPEQTSSLISSLEQQSKKVEALLHEVKGLLTS